MHGEGLKEQHKCFITRVIARELAKKSSFFFVASRRDKKMATKARVRDNGANASLISSKVFFLHGQAGLKGQVEQTECKRGEKMRFVKV